MIGRTILQYKILEKLDEGEPVRRCSSLKLGKII